MILFETTDDIFESSLQTIACPVNKVGVMGNGLALAFKNRFPGLLVDYRRDCLNDAFADQRFTVKTYDGRQVMCFPTKGHWSEDSSLDNIRRTLLRIERFYTHFGIASLALPAVGCGKGGLHFDDVRTAVFDVLGRSELPVGLYWPTN